MIIPMDDKDLHFLGDLMPWSSRVQRECPSQHKRNLSFQCTRIYKCSNSCRNAGIFHCPVLMFEDLREGTFLTTIAMSVLATNIFGIIKSAVDEYDAKSSKATGSD